MRYIFNELFRDDQYVYVQIIDYPGIINKKIPIQKFDLWKKDNLEK